MSAYPYYTDAKNIVKQKNIVINTEDERYYKYYANHGIYKLCSDNIIKRMITDYYMNAYEDSEVYWNPSYTNTIFNSLAVTAKRINGLGKNEDIIVYNNGVLNLQTKALVPYNKSFKATSKIAFDYSVGTSIKTPVFDKYLDDISVGDLELKTTLMEIIGYCLTNHIRAGKCFILFGSGSNGKSVFLNLLAHLVGGYSALNIKDVNKSKFSLSSMIGYRINVVNELDNGLTLDDIFNANMKSIITGEPVRVEPKGKPLFSHVFSTKMIMATNTLPGVNKIPDYSVKRRFCLLPFDATFAGNKVDRYILDKLKGETKGIIAKAMQAYFDFQARDYHFTYEKKSDELYDEEVQRAFPVVMFVKDKIQEAKGTGSRISYKDIRAAYEEWCVTKKIPKSQINDKFFSVQINRALTFNNISQHKRFKSNGVRGIEGISMK